MQQEPLHLLQELLDEKGLQFVLIRQISYFKNYFDIEDFNSNGDAFNKIFSPLFYQLELQAKQ